MSSEFKKDTIPLVVDLDGTLIYGDITQELILRHLMERPLIGVFEVLRMYFSGKSQMKDDLTLLHVNKLELDKYPLSKLNEQPVVKNAKNKIIVTGSNQKIADIFLSRFDDFDAAYGSTREHNLTGKNKAAFLKEKFPNGFDYIGNDSVDTHIWKHARQAIGYNVTSSAIRSAKDDNIKLDVLKQKSSTFKQVIKEMRLHQWAKNALLFVPALLSLSEIASIDIVLLIFGFFAFGLVASSTYILNDLLDLKADRAHSKKVNRPIARGKLSIFSALIATFALFATGICIAFIMQPFFATILLIYSVISLCYSIFLKKLEVIDVMVLSGLFCGRVLAGGALIGSSINIWFMLCLFFFFLSLSLGKRTIEILGLKDKKKIAGRGYSTHDKFVVMTSGICSGFISIVIVQVYFLLSKSAAIQTPIGAIAVIILIVAWLLRFWLLIGRNELNHDPVVYAVSDKISITILGSIGLVLLADQVARVLL